MRTESDISRIFPLPKSGTTTIGVPMCRLVIAGQLEVTLQSKM